MKSRVEVFVLSYIVWFLLVWPYSSSSGSWDVQGLAAGLAVSVLVSIIFGGDFAENPGKILEPARWFYLMAFIPVFILYSVKASLQVAYLVLHPRLPIKPGIVRFKTSLRDRAALTALANCITLTPGTLTVEVTDEGVLYVHWISVTALEEEEAARMIAGKFERYLKRIFED